MYNENSIGKVKSDIKRKPTDVGESIEEMIRRCVESNEPIDSVAPMIYTEEADGVLPQYDIRADRFDIALDAIDKFQASEMAKGKGLKEQPESTPAEQAPAEASEATE